jgi:hypothetical protein
MREGRDPTATDRSPSRGFEFVPDEKGTLGNYSRDNDLSEKIVFARGGAKGCRESSSHAALLGCKIVRLLRYWQWE